MWGSNLCLIFLHPCLIWTSMLSFSTYLTFEVIISICPSSKKKIYLAHTRYLSNFKFSSFDYIIISKYMILQILMSFKLSILLAYHYWLIILYLKIKLIFSMKISAKCKRYWLQCMRVYIELDYQVFAVIPSEFSIVV